MTQKKKITKDIYEKIIVGVISTAILALIVGTTKPWWWPGFTRSITAIYNSITSINMKSSNNIAQNPTNNVSVDIPKEETKLDNSTIGKIKSDNVYLGQDIKAYQKEHMMEYPDQGSFTVSGNRYTKGIVNGEPNFSGNYSGTAYYNVDGQYKSMAGLYAPVDGTTSKDGTISIYGDDKELKYFKVNGGDLAKSFQIDITNVKQIKIVFSGDSTTPSSYAIANMVFKK